MKPFHKFSASSSVSVSPQRAAEVLSLFEQKKKKNDEK